MTAGEVSTTGTQSLFFYLSHAHDDAEPSGDLDRWVNAFYLDLAEAVRQRLSIPTKQVGAYRSCANGAAGSGGNSAVTAARVFVPLYSLAYLNDGRAMGERSAFIVSDWLTGRGRIVPVLWQPAESTVSRPELDEAARVSPILEYNARGLLELSRAPEHRDAYRRVVAFLADRIVGVAEGRDDRRAQSAREQSAPKVSPVPPRTRFVLTLVANDETSLVIRLAERLTTDLEREGHYEVRTVRYPREGDGSGIGLFLIDGAVLADMPADLKDRILKDSRLAVTVGLSSTTLRLEDPLSSRLHALPGRNSRLQIRSSPEPIVLIAKEILRLLRRHSAGRTQPRPYPPRTTLHD